MLQLDEIQLSRSFLILRGARIVITKFRDPEKRALHCMLISVQHYNGYAKCMYKCTFYKIYYRKASSTVHDVVESVRAFHYSMFAIA